jgi:hypothetical protein
MLFADPAHIKQSQPKACYIIASAAGDPVELIKHLLQFLLRVCLCLYL